MAEHHAFALDGLPVDPCSFYDPGFAPPPGGAGDCAMAVLALVVCAGAARRQRLYSFVVQRHRSRRAGDRGYQFLFQCNYSRAGVPDFAREHVKAAMAGHCHDPLWRRMAGLAGLNFVRELP